MSNDFFNSVPFSGQDSTNQGESVDSFAQAIAARFGSADLLTARLLPDDIRKDDHNQQIPQHHHPHLPKSSVSLPSPTFPLMPPPHTNQPHDLLPPRSEPHSIQPFCSIPPLALLPYLSDTSTLILDIRPHAAHVSARINRALSLSVPSTLLKRPLFSLSKLAQMLPSSSARSRFSTWPAASRILVYDADSAHLPHNSNIAGLLRKFRAEGFTGELGWVRGGFQAVWREARELTTTEQPSTEDEDAEPGSATSALRTKHLPKIAFSVSSTINLGAVLGATEVPRVSQTFSQAANPFFDVIRQNVELSHGITERIPLRLPRRVRRRLNDLPFQWLREIARRSAIRDPSPSSRIPGSESESSDEPHSSDPDEHDPEVEEGTEALAMQFYRIELAEQRRLQTIMEHHSKESEMAATDKAYCQTQGGKSSTVRGDQGADYATGPTPVTKATPHAPHSSFPFSITAGVEKGTKNRYKYIWPFEHARVRLHDGRHQGSHPGMGNKGKSTDRGSNRTRDGIRQRSVSQFGSSAVTAEGIDSTLERALLNQANSPADFVDTDTRMLEFLTSPMDISPIATQLPGLLSSPSEGALPESTITRITPFPLRHPHSQVAGPMDTSTHTGHSLPLTNAATLLGDNIGHSTSVDLQQGDNILPGAQRVSSPLDDYVNASYVQPLGTRKKYIATQGPLPATFVDFWTLVWEQNVHVIVMLTREIENAMVKCGTYWTDASYGPFRLELLSTSPPVTPSATTNSTDANREGFFFALREPRTKNHGIKSTPTTITRKFALSHSSYPGVLPRCIIHLQYLDWPDMNVPDDPRGVLGLVKRVERAVAESSPGPSPSGSGSQSPGSSISPGSTSLACESRHLACNKHGRGWRHPELDPHTGVATFALGKSPPVLLHCSAGVGRTGGFIAVDAVLDGIRRELNETRRTGAFPHAGADIHSKDNRRGDIETAASGMENIPTGNGDRDLMDGMDIDKPSSGDGQVDSPGFMATAPLHVTAGDRKKSRKHQRTNRIGEESSSSESLVLHVPIAMHSDGVKSLGATYMQLDDPKTTGWQNLSTRAWAERVSNQTNARAGTMNPSEALTAPMPISAPHLSSRARSPESASSSSPLSADDSVGGSTGGNIGGGDSNCNKERKSESIGASGNGGRAGIPPSSTSVSSASRSISISNSNSGTGSSSQFGSSPRVDATNFMSLMRSRLMESSATSLSNISADSLPSNKVQRPTPIRESSALRGSPCINACMDVDRPRAISVPLNRGDQSTLNGSIAQYTHYQCRAHRKSSLDSSLATRFSAPSLTDASVRGVPFIGGTGKGSYSNFSSDDFIGSGQDFESSAGFYSQWSNKGSQVATDESAGNMHPREVEDPMETNIASGNNGFTTDIPISCDTKDKTKVKTIGGPTPGMRNPTARHPIAGDSAELDPDNPVIDYKLPRPLHTEVLPPFLTSYQNPIWVVVQDMREQRMSLCQSLRQYVFVHAAVVEGALQIVDEERELWEDTSGSDEDPGFDFGASLGGEKVYEGDHDRKAWARNATGVRGPTTTLPSSVVSSSPSKGKRGPSPTELLKEDRTGALSLTKRPSIKRKPPSEDGTLLTFEEDALPPPTESIENTTGPEIPSSSTILDTRRSIQNKKSR